MNTTVIEHILPITEEDSKLIRKNSKVTIIAVLVFEAIVTAMFYFIFLKSFDYHIGIWIFYGFFLLVGGIILTSTLMSFFAKTKLVSEGYITNKRTHTSHSSSSSKIGSSSSTSYYFTLGEKERSVLYNEYFQVAKGDKVRIHETKNNSSIFKIEVLEREADAESSFKDTFKTYKNTSNVNFVTQTKNEYITNEDKSILKSQLLKLIFYRILGLGIVAVIIYFVLALVCLIVLTIFNLNHLLKHIHYLFIILSAGFYILVNKKTYFTFMDLTNGTKIITLKCIRDVINSNKMMLSKNITITSSSTGNYVYVETTDGKFYIINEILGVILKNGDTIWIHESEKSKTFLQLELNNN